MTVIHSKDPVVRKISSLADRLVLAVYSRDAYADPEVEVAFAVALSRIHLQRLYALGAKPSVALEWAKALQPLLGRAYSHAMSAQIEDFLGGHTNDGQASD